MSYQVTGRFGTITATSGVAEPFFWDVNAWDQANWDVTTPSAGGVTEEVAVYVSLATTGLNLPFLVTATLGKPVRYFDPRYFNPIYFQTGTGD